jgi:hypothetical protein
MVSTSRSAVARTGLLLTLLMSAAFLGAGQASGAQFTISWVDNSNGVAATLLERRVPSIVPFVTIATVPPGVTEYVDTSISPGTMYCYRALAYVAEGVSPSSEEACAIWRDPGYELIVTVSKDGDGGGTVVSTPAGVFCGTDCSETYRAGSAVTLIAVPAPGSTFTGWSGSGCDGSEPCTVAGQGVVAVTATFTASFFRVPPLPGPPSPGPPPFYVPRLPPWIRF